MKEEILDISKRLYHNHLTPEKATELLLNLIQSNENLYGVYSIDDELLHIHKTKEGAKKHQYEFEKEHGFGFYVDPVLVLE